MNSGLQKLSRALLGEKAIYAAFAAIVIYFSFATSNRFNDRANWEDILMRAAISTPIALGIMLAVVLRGIDLSSGTTLGLLGIVMTMNIEAGKGLGESIFYGMAVALAIGIINAVLIAQFNIEPFLATLSIQFIGSSIERGLTRGGLPIYLYGSNSGLDDIYRASLMGIPMPIVILLAVVLAYYIVLEKSSFGRCFYACGSSLKGAVNAGINIKRYYAAVFIVAALSAGVAGVLVASQVRSGQPLVGGSYLWDAIGAAFLSTLLSKRNRPNVIGTVFGTLLFAMIHSGLTLIGMDFYWKKFFQGLITLSVLLASSRRRA